MSDSAEPKPTEEAVVPAEKRLAEKEKPGVGSPTLRPTTVAAAMANLHLNQGPLCKWKAHPWHGIPIGIEAPVVLTAFIEVVPSDYVKFELDKETGHLKIDRPQKFSNVTPTMYGFFPQTHCGERVAQYAGVAVADGDPLDVCVLTERPVSHGDFIVKVVPIGGFRMIDHGEADDKILAFVQSDEVYSKWRTITDVPQAIVRRLVHYFQTYKTPPGEPPQSEIRAIYGRDEAHEVIRRSQQDYESYLVKHYASYVRSRFHQGAPDAQTPQTH